MSKNSYESQDLNFYDNPISALMIHPDLVDSVSGDPEKVRQIARVFHKAIVGINHPDKGGDGSLIAPATDAIDEINRANPQEMAELVEEFYESGSQSPGGEAQAKARKAYLNEINRRQDETRFLYRLMQNGTPDFNMAFVQLGQSTIEEEGDSMLLSPLIPSSAKFAILDSNFQGNLVSPRVPNGANDYNIELSADSVIIDSLNRVSLSAAESKVAGDSISSADNQQSDFGEEILISMESDTTYGVKNAMGVVGVIDREVIEDSSFGSSQYQEEDSTTLLESPKGPSVFDVSWQDVASFPLLREMNLVNEADQMLNKYLVIGHESEAKLALLGLCRQIG